MEIAGHSYPAVILDLYAHGKKIQCNIVGALAAKVQQPVLTMYQRPPVILLQCFKLKVDRGPHGLAKVILQNVVHVSRIYINPDFKETVDFLNNYDIGRHYFPRLQQTNTGSLISQVDDPAFDWKLLRTVQNLKSTNEDGVFFLVGKIMEVVDDPEWWFFSCVCGQQIIGDDNVFRCQACAADVEHFTVKYRVKVVIEDGTSLSLFVLLDAAVTKLLGKTCSDAFLVPGKQTQFSFCSPLFKDLLGLEKIFKVQRRKIDSSSYRGTFKIVDVFGDASSFPAPSAVTTCNDIITGPIFTPIFPNYVPYARVEDYMNQVPAHIPIQLDAIKDLLDDVVSVKIVSAASRNIDICFFLGSIVSIARTQKWFFLSCLCGSPISQVADVYYCATCGLECVNAIPSYRLKVLVSHSNGNNIFILDDAEVSQIVNIECSDLLQDKPTLTESIHDFMVPDLLYSRILNRRLVFIVDPRPIGYESNISVHIVRAISDDPSIIKIFQDASTINEEKLAPLDPCPPKIPLEFKYNLTMVSNTTSDGPSTSVLPVHCVSPKSVLNSSCLGIHEPDACNALLPASLGSSECPNVLTIGEELQARFGKRKNDETPDQMDESSS